MIKKQLLRKLYYYIRWSRLDKTCWTFHQITNV